MKKVIFILVLLLLVVIGGGVYYLLTNLNSLVASSIEEYGSKAVKTRVRVKAVDIRLREAQASVSGLTVANPEGFEKRAAFSMTDITVGLDIKNSSAQLITINKINITAPQVYYEVNRDRKNNLDRLKKNILGTGQATDKSSGSKTEPKLHIKELNFKDAALLAKFVPLNNKKVDLKLPTLRLTNLKGTPQQISRQIMDALIDHAKAEIKKSKIAAEIDRFKGEAKQKLEEEKAKVKQQADEKLDAEKQKVQDKLKGLLGQ